MYAGRYISLIIIEEKNKCWCHLSKLHVIVHELCVLSSYSIWYIIKICLQNSKCCNGAETGASAPLQTELQIAPGACLTRRSSASGAAALEGVLAPRECGGDGGPIGWHRGWISPSPWKQMWNHPNPAWWPRGWEKAWLERLRADLQQSRRLRRATVNHWDLATEPYVPPMPSYIQKSAVKCLCWNFHDCA